VIQAWDHTPYLDELRATPEHTGLFYHDNTHYMPLDTWRLTRVQEMSIRVEVPREEWDSVWTYRLEDFFKNRVWNDFDASYMVRLSDFGRLRGWDNLDTIQEVYSIAHIDPVTGRRYDTVSDFFKPGYDPKPIIMPELRAALQRNRIPESEIEAIYDRLMVSGIGRADGNDAGSSLSFAFHWDWNRESGWEYARQIAYYAPLWFTVPFGRFDTTQLAIERW
jgi:hypothetical protein